MILFGDEALICIDGSFDEAQAMVVSDAVDEARRAGAHRVVIDLLQVPHIDEVGAAALAAAAAVLHGGLMLLMADGAIATVDDAPSLRALLNASRS